MKTNNFMTAKVIALLGLIFVLNACKKDSKDVAQPVNPIDQELITTLTLVVSPASTPNNQQYFSYRDLDGDGGNPPKIDTIRLLENTTYHVQLLVLDETKSPADTTSKEILKEKDIHEFFFSKVGTFDLTTTYLDSDDNGVPVGLNISINAGSAFTTKTNTYKVVLKHQPGLKPTSGKGNVNLGETDIEVDFPITISTI
jgi:hypothetical protein